MEARTLSCEFSYFVKNNNGKEGYIKVNQLYYFRKDIIDYEVIGHLDVDIFNLLN